MINSAGWVILCNLANCTVVQECWFFCRCLVPPHTKENQHHGLFFKIFKLHPEPVFFDLVDPKWLDQRLAELRSQAVQERLSKGFITAKIEDPELARSSSAMTYMLQQTAVVKLCRDAVVAPTSPVQ